MANGIRFGQNINGRASGPPANGDNGIKNTRSKLPTPSAGRSHLVPGGIGSTLTGARNVARVTAARFRRPSRRSTAS